MTGTSAEKCWLQYGQTVVTRTCRYVVLTGHHGDGAVKTQGCYIPLALNTFKYHNLILLCFRRAEAPRR